MKNYKLINNVAGWLVFLVAAITYLLTIEPTASFWDCGEFITTSYKLEVGHPPGAPFFNIIGRFFTILAGSSSKAAMAVNSLSALASAFTILFLFWTITHLAKKIIGKQKELTLGQTIAIIGSGIVGALAYTFSDTFWFSAVEGEVYASSSLITALVFWAILKWEDAADEPYANRWIIFIAYMVGLSIGVHLLNLLAIPAIVFVYYFKKYNVTKKGIFYCLIISFIILGAVMYLIIPGVIKIAALFERIFVNGFGLPYNTGVIFYAILLIAVLVWGIKYTIKKNKVLWNTAILSIAVILIGYSSFAIVVIRSAADPPMDQNSPDDVFALLRYLNREQYGNRPLFYGQYYNTPINPKEPYKEGSPYYIKKDGKYVISNTRDIPQYDKDFCTFFPRMYSNNGQHIKDYKQWAEIKGRKISYTDRSGKAQTTQLPTFSENLTFFLRYQVGFMYLRYFMWNFAGRQNDIQGHGGTSNGNWLSGINFIDSMRLGDQKSIPDHMKSNKARNTYYFFPLILGLIGFFYMYNKGTEGKKDLWIVFLLFIMTGLAIVVYLNQYPHQPRERDYAYAGSFYAFSIWIGLGVLSLYELLKKRIPEPISAAVVSALALILVPGIMAAENWDDHDRSDRYTCRDFGANYLNSCQPNSVIFTNGDNDTFPLWYNQEVEGVRTDVRVCNLSYFQTDWYINQMKRKAYDSDPLPINFTPDQYVQGTRDVVYLMNDARIKKPIELKKALNFVKNDDSRTKLKQAGNASYIPTKKLFYVVDKEAVIRNKVVPPEDYNNIVDTIYFNFSNKSYIAKDELMLLDMIDQNNWERPIYWAITVGRDKYMGLQDFFRLEGFAYRFVPVKSKSGNSQFGGVNTDLMYKHFVKDFKWGNMNDPNVYIDENNSRMMMNIRNNFNRLAGALINEGKRDSAIEVLDMSTELIPQEVVPYSYFAIMMAENYFKAGAKEKGSEIIQTMHEKYQVEMDYFLSQKKELIKANNDIQRILYFLREISSTSIKYGDKEIGKEIADSFNQYYKTYSSIVQ